MKTAQRIFVFYAVAFVVAYLANISAARPTDLAEESVELGLMSLNSHESDTRGISEMCPPWLARLPGGCSRLLRLRRSATTPKKPKRGFCPPSMPRCPQ